MKTKRSTLIGLLSTLLVIITVLSSVLVFTAVADGEPAETGTEDKYVINAGELEITNLCFKSDDWANPDKWAQAGSEGVTIIDLEGIEYDTVAIEIPKDMHSTANSTNFRFLFVTEYPEIGNAVALADGTDVTIVNFRNSNLEGSYVYAKLPADAKYLVIQSSYYNNGRAEIELGSVVFENTNPSLLDNSLLSFSYPIENIKYSAGSLWADGTGTEYKINVYSKSGKYYLPRNDVLIPLDGCEFEKVRLVGNGQNSVYAAFLSELPELGEDASFAGDCEGMTRLCGSSESIELDIPEDAKYLAVLYRYGESSTYDFQLPSEITFINTDPATDYRIEISSVAARLNASSGLRFTTRIPTADLAGIDYTVGTLIYPTDKLDGALTVDTTDALNIEMTNGVAGNEYTYFTASMTNIHAQNYARKFTAVSYIEVDGKYYYTVPTTSSIYEAAIATYKENQNDAYADAVRAYIDGVVVIEDGEQVMPYDGYEHPMTVTFSKYGTSATISGDGLTADSLKTVILDGEIYTGGWTFANGEFTITVGAEYSYPMNDLEPVEGAIPKLSNNPDQLYTDDKGAEIVFIDLEALGYDYDKLIMKLGQVDGGWTAYWFLTEMPTKGESVSYAGDQTNRHETSGAGKETKPISIPEDAKILAIYYSDPGYVYCPVEIGFVGGNRLNAN